jgi:hypothetical protein
MGPSCGRTTKEIENFSALSGLITGFKHCHGLVFKKLTGGSSAVDTNTMDLWFERFLKLLEGCEAQDIYNADETGLFINCQPGWTQDRPSLEENV